jgi:tetratricopeptide (TPR) repeat protein
MEDEELQKGLASLQASEFLYETNLFPEREFTFKHALTHEVTYGSLVQERKRSLHAAIVGVIEQLAGDRLEEQVERLAHHAYEGGVWDKAAAYLRMEGERAMARSVHRVAAGSLEKALASLKHLPESRETIEKTIDVQLDLRLTLLPLMEYDQVLKYLREAEALAKGLSDQRRLGWVSNYMMIYLWVTGDPEQALEIGHRVSAIASELDDFSLKIVANTYSGGSCYQLGDYRRAIEVCRENMDSLQGDMAHERFRQVVIPSVMTRTFMTWCMAELGMFSEGVDVGEEEVRIAEEVGHLFSNLVAFLGLGYVHLRQGNFQKAIPVLERGIDLRRGVDSTFWFPWVESALGYALAMSGESGEGHLRRLERVIEEAVSSAMMYSSTLLNWLGEVHLMSEQADKALKNAEHALQLARKEYDPVKHHTERGDEAWALRLIGGIHSHPDALDAQKAEDFFREAIARAEELGMRPLIAHCRKGLGALYGRNGNREMAHVELTAAAGMYREMEMTFWMDRIEAELPRAE